jgi:hypothetical protein
MPAWNLWGAVEYRSTASKAQVPEGNFAPCDLASACRERRVGQSKRCAVGGSSQFYLLIVGGVCGLARLVCQIALLWLVLSPCWTSMLWPLVFSAVLVFWGALPFTLVYGSGEEVERFFEHATSKFVSHFQKALCSLLSLLWTGHQSTKIPQLQFGTEHAL